MGDRASREAYPSPTASAKSTYRRLQGDGSRHQELLGGHIMIMGYQRLKEFLRRSAGLNIDKSDMERLTELIGRKLNDLLVIGVRNASYNNRDIIMEPDLPLTKGVLERLKDFRHYEESIDLKPILDHLTTYPPLERPLSLEVEAML